MGDKITPFKTIVRFVNLIKRKLMKNSQKTRTESSLECYSTHPALRGLVNVIPAVGPLIDGVIVEIWEHLKAKRLREFFDQLAQGKVLVTEEHVANEEFVHCFIATSKAVTFTNRHEKIAMFARLLESVVKRTNDFSIDEYEEFLNILDELSYREILVLHILDQYSGTPRENHQNDLQWTCTFWDDFVDEIREKLQIHPAQITSILARLARTGCYDIFTGYFDTKGDKGQLTPLYYRLKTLVYKYDK